MFVVCTLLLGFQLVFNQVSWLLKKKKKKKTRRRKEKKKEKKGKKKKIVAAEGAKAIARFVLPREMRKDIWTHGHENFEMFASERLCFQETLKESKVDIFIQQIFLCKR